MLDTLRTEYMTDTEIQIENHWLARVGTKFINMYIIFEIVGIDAVVYN